SDLGAALKQLTITRVGSVELDEAVTATVGEDPATVGRRLEEAGRRHCILLDTRGRPLRWVSLRELRSGSAALAAADRDESLEVVTLQSTLNDALDTMLTSSHGVVVVTGRRDTYQGVIRVETITNAIQSMRASAESSTPSEEQSGGGVHTP